LLRNQDTIENLMKDDARWETEAGSMASDDWFAEVLNNMLALRCEIVTGA